MLGGGTSFKPRQPDLYRPSWRLHFSLDRFSLFPKASSVLQMRGETFSYKHLGWSTFSGIHRLSLQTEKNGITTVTICFEKEKHLTNWLIKSVKAFLWKAWIHWWWCSRVPGLSLSLCCTVGGSLDDAQRVTEKGNILFVFITMGGTNRGGTLIVIRLWSMCCEMVRFLLLFVHFLHKKKILALFFQKKDRGYFILRATWQTCMWKGTTARRTHKIGLFNMLFFFFRFYSCVLPLSWFVPLLTVTHFCEVCVNATCKYSFETKIKEKCDHLEYLQIQLHFNLVPRCRLYS